MLVQRDCKFAPKLPPNLILRTERLKTTVAASRCLAATYDLARTTGLEPATTGSTVRYSNQLSYVPKVLFGFNLR